MSCILCLLSFVLFISSLCCPCYSRKWHHARVPHWYGWWKCKWLIIIYNTVIMIRTFFFFLWTHWYNQMSKLTLPFLGQVFNFMFQYESLVLCWKFKIYRNVPLKKENCSLSISIDHTVLWLPVNLNLMHMQQDIFHYFFRSIH